MSSAQVISKQRVSKDGEVYTNPREVNAMLDLVKGETLRIESRFLEPACGTGNFLIEILRRKLAVVEKLYKKSQLEYERYAIVAVSSLYGIELLPDNIAICRERLFAEFEQQYRNLFKGKVKAKCINTVRHLLKCNLLQGDALTLKTLPDNKPIIFPEWTLLNNQFKRHDFIYLQLVDRSALNNSPHFSDLGKKFYKPKPLDKYYPLVHFLELADE